VHPEGDGAVTDCGLKILFVEDEPLDVQLEQHALKRGGIRFTGRIASNEQELCRELAEFNPDVVLCDYTMPGFSGRQALATVQGIRPATPIVMVCGSIDDYTAIDCLHSGAIDYLLKSNLHRLGPAVRRAVTEARQRHSLESRIEQLAHYDTLTGLPNRFHVNRSVDETFQRARSHHSVGALVVLNLDQFRRIDEAFGRSASDEVLREIGAMLKIQSRGCDVVARIGPNEFLLAFSCLGDAQQAGTLVQGLLCEIQQPRSLAGRNVRISASAGIALYPADGLDLESLLCKATAAMHEAKSVSPGSFQFHSSDVVQYARLRHELETRLRNAVQRQELSLFFQPQYEIRSGEICGVEALARWFQDGSTVSPSVFIPLAEQTGIIDDLGCWALRAGCLAAAEWSCGRSRKITVSVNVSTRQVREDFTGEIEQALRANRLAGEQLELEITESILLTDVDRALRCLTEWKGLGVHIALDDFGTGYSNLGYLAKLPIDRLKLDGSLIRGMTRESKDATVVRAMITLGRELGITVLAEGVETEEQLAMLSKFGCQQVQGYLMTPPAPQEEARKLMRRRWGMREVKPLPERVYQ
jgi:diguanylate cyclase (GGDEF)-like protein